MSEEGGKRDRISRRRLLGAGGAFAAGGLLGGLGASQAQGQAAGQQAQLSQSGRITFKSLVEAVAAAPDSPVDGAQAQALTDRLAQTYANADDARRRGIDVLLDALEDGLPRGALGTARSGREKARVVHSQLRDGKRYRDSGLVKRNLVLRAVEMAAAPFASDTVREPAAAFINWSPS